MDKLLEYMPKGASRFLEKWGKGYRISILITKERDSKLGDYYKDPQGVHRISMNYNLPPELFFFVFTHEMAHLHAFEKYGRRIAPHGIHWKSVYQQMLFESLDIYNEKLRTIVLQYAKNPKANFNAFPPLVRYFHREQDGEVFVEQLPKDSFFVYRGEIYQMLGRLKKNYLCIQQGSQRKYTFSPLTSVIKIEK